jgi:hypothetical protein
VPPKTAKQAKALDLDVSQEVAAAAKALAPAAKRITAAMKKLDPGKLPVGALADTLYEMRQLGKVLNTLTAPFDDVMPDALKAVEEHFVQTLRVGESSGVQGMRSRVQITESAVPIVKDWPALYAHILKTKSFELLNRAPNRLAIQERWDSKKQVPGVDKFIAKKVSCTKLGGK